MGNLAPLMSSAKDDWETPDSLLELVGPIELDVATKITNPTRAQRGFVSDDDFNSTDFEIKENHRFPVGVEPDAFSHTWGADGLVWCNPPYGRKVGDWIGKATTECDEAMFLLPARTDTKWFQRYGNYPQIRKCFIGGRLKFKGAPAPAPFPSVLLYWGPGIKRFRETFEKIGVVML